MPLGWPLSVPLVYPLYWPTHTKALIRLFSLSASLFLVSDKRGHVWAWTAMGEIWSQLEAGPTVLRTEQWVSRQHKLTMPTWWGTWLTAAHGEEQKNTQCACDLFLFLSGTDRPTMRKRCAKRRSNGHGWSFGLLTMSNDRTQDSGRRCSWERLMTPMPQVKVDEKQRCDVDLGGC